MSPNRSHEKHAVSLPSNVRSSGAASFPARATVLVVDDEEGLRGVLRRLLQDEGYTVLEAHNGVSALELLADQAGQDVGLVLTDLRMPVMDGRQLAAALARLQPTLPIVFMSGFTAQLMDLRLVSPHLAFLPKPFQNDALLATVRERLEPRSHRD